MANERHIPHHAHPDQFKKQAKELLKQYRSGDTRAVELFTTFHPNLPISNPKLADAQIVIARQFGQQNWKHLLEAVESVDRFRQLLGYFSNDDKVAAKELLQAYPQLLKRKDLLGRAVRHGKSVAMLKLVHEMSQGDVQDALGYLVYELKEDMAEYLLKQEARFEKMELLPGSEVLNSQVMKYALKYVRLKDFPDMAKASIAMLLSTYSRNPQEKHQCLKLIESQGITLADTAPMAVHKGDLNSLKKHLKAKPELFKTNYSEADIYPPSWGIKAGDGLHLAPLNGAGLLHMAAEYDEQDLLNWILEAGADPNFKAAVDQEGYGGHTALYHTTVSYTFPDSSKAKALLKTGANPAIRATIRKQLRYMGQRHLEEMYTFEEVTAVDFAHQFQMQAWVSHASITVIEDHQKK
ncbi:MAG: hypothetical protein AAGD28_32105 [Bacteroidota bacterium]